MDFRDRTTTRKGTLGEAIGERILMSAGWIPYQPPASMAHPIDRLVLHRGDHRAFACDMKAKPKRLAYPDTGIDMAKRDEYLELCHVHHLDCLLIFLDEDMGKAYYAFLLDLERHRCIKHNNRTLEYPRTEWVFDNRASGAVCEIRFYPILAFVKYVPLTPDEIRHLQSLSTRDPKYQAVANHKAQQGNLF